MTKFIPGTQEWFSTRKCIIIINYINKLKDKSYGYNNESQKSIS